VKSLPIVEVDDASALASELFHAAFGHPVPAFPRHFIAFYRDRTGAFRVAAYIHHSVWGDDAYLAGGLCVDREAYAHARPEDAAEWKRAGGIGEILQRECFARLTDRAAIFGHCGNPRQWPHSIQSGFEAAGPEYLLVRWNRPLSQEAKAEFIARAVALGPF